MGVVLLVRHGQASFGADDYDVLSELGWEQGRTLGRFLADTETPTSWVRGGLRRHRETLEAMTSDEARVDDRWDEFDHVDIVATHPDAPVGDVEPREFQRVFERATAEWIAGTHAGSETYADFAARVLAAFDDAVAEAGSGRTVVVVTSGGAIAVVAAALVDAAAVEDPPRLGALWARFNTVTVNAGLTRVVVGSTGARLLTFNEHAFLPGGQRTYR